MAHLRSACPLCLDQTDSFQDLRRSLLAQKLATRMLELGVYVVGFFFPVVPQGKARIRVQMSAAHTRADLEFAVAAFTQAGRELGLIA